MRSFESFDLIQLPRLSAEETLALGRELETEARGAGKVPEAVSEALDEVVVTRDALAKALLRRHRSAEGRGVDPVKAREADRVVDNAWGALRDFLAAWGRLDGDERGGRARELLAWVFPDGLGFLSKPFKAEWADSETRLALIKNEGLDAEIEGLGGAPFVRALRKAHREYGEALHVTATRPAPAETVDLREVQLAAHDALREYLVQVAASRRRQKPATVELADRLLGPVARWAAGRRAAKKAVDEPAPEPADPSEND